MPSDDSFPPYRRWLAAQSDEYLGRLLHSRPDTLTPPPKTTGTLAARLQLRASQQRVLPHLTALALACLEAAVGLDGETGPVTARAISDELRAALAEADVPAGRRPTLAHVREALDELRDAGLIYGDGPAAGGRFTGRKREGRDARESRADHLMLVDGAWAALPPGWRLLPRPGEPSVDDLREALSRVDTRQRRLLRTLHDANGLGTTRDAADGADPDSPVQRLLAAGLIERVGGTTVRLPHPVRMLMDGETPAPRLTSLRPEAPEVTEPREIDDAAAGAALETVRRLRDLLELLGQVPAATIRDGSIGLREQRRLLEATGLDLTELANLLALARGAGLVAVGTPHPLPANDNGGDYLAPTDGADDFLTMPLAGAWAALIDGLRDSDRAPWLVGTDGPDGKPIHLLARDASRANLPRLRTLLGDLLCDEVAPGLAVARPDAEFMRLRPLIARYTSLETRDGVTAQLMSVGLVIREGRALAATSAWRAARGHRGRELAGKLAGMLPPPVTVIVPQADLTVLVPGPAGPELSVPLSRFAAVESPGLASVYRVTEDSVRAGLDAGMTAAEMHSFLAERSLGEVPQSLTYLIDDVARRHGRLRAGAAASYIRCEDPAALAAILGDPVAPALGLRRLADTVAISRVPCADLLEVLRDAGHIAVAEDDDGVVLDIGPRPVRVERVDSPPPASPHAGVDAIAAAIAAVRAGDRAAGEGDRLPLDDDPASGAAAQSLLTEAARTGRDVVIGYVDRNGLANRRRVRPVTVTGGQVDAIDPATGDARRFLLHRVTDVQLTE